MGHDHPGAGADGGPPVSERRRLGTRIVIGLAFLIFMTTLIVALASLLRLGGSDEADSSATSAPPETAPAAPSAAPDSTPVLVDANRTSVGCYREVSGVNAGSFVVHVTTELAQPEELTVGVDLITASGNRQARAVPVPLAPGVGETIVVVPDSNGSTAFVDCAIAAVQQGERVTLTGN